MARLATADWTAWSVTCPHASKIWGNSIMFSTTHPMARTAAVTSEALISELR